MKRALITGISGQDGSYLAELLLEKGYEVHGMVRALHGAVYPHLDDAFRMANGRLQLHFGDLGDAASMRTVIDRVAPDEVYNLGAQSHVHLSFEVPEYTGDVTGLGTVRLLEALRLAGGKARFYQASSSELFGKVRETPQNEQTPFHPRSPYAVAKAYAFHVTRNYREAYDMFAVNGILFNHESERRGETFVTRKITLAVARIKHGLQDKLVLGNTDAKRDWGHAADYVDAMWRMLQAETPEDFVIGTGENHSVQEFVELAFGHVGLDWHDYVETDPKFLRPSEVDVLVANPSKAEQQLGWERKVDFATLVERMLDHDLALAERAKAAE